MVPWRATEDGIVTPDILDWYRRFAEGRPGAIVVEATGIRDIPSGPLLRIGHDRFLPGLSKLTETVRKASGGYTRLFIQIIDFLSIRRRPLRERYLGEFLKITPDHIDKLNLSESAPEVGVRSALAGMSDEELIEVLDEREWEALQYGARERVTDTELAHIRDLPRKLPGLFADAAWARTRGRLRRRRTALRARLHDGLVSVLAEHSRGRVRRQPRRPGAPARGGLRGRAATGWATTMSWAAGCSPRTA